MLPIVLLFLAQSEIPRDVVQLARIEHDMTVTLAKMPDYTCVETIARSSRVKGAKKFKINDTLQVDVAFVGGKELFGRHDAGRIDKNHPSSFTGHGVSSSGEFAGFARSLFADRTATIRYSGPDALAGRPALRWDYRIPILSSGWSLNYAGRLTQVGSKGFFLADPESLDLLKLDIDATDIEHGFPIAATHLSIEYEKVRLAGKVVPIPSKSELLLTGSDGNQDLNVVHFNHCREYGADSAISFDEGASAKK